MPPRTPSKRENSSNTSPPTKSSFSESAISNASTAPGGSDKRAVVFFHPDLGIGGAERLVVDAAVGLQARGRRVVIFTSYCDAGHCFEEARDGSFFSFVFNGTR